MLVAVTGGTGFIGRHLIRRMIDSGHSVRLFTRNDHPPCNYLADGVQVYKSDLLHAAVKDLSLILNGVDVLFHCAGQLNDARGMRALHVDATKKLAEAAAGRIGRWVQLSSVGVYGPLQTGVITEETNMNPVGQYEITKSESDRMVVQMAQRGAFDYSILRPSNVFGPDMRNQSLFAMTAMIDRGMFFFIGSRDASANYVHVDNVVQGLMLCAISEAASGRVYNLSDYWTLERFVGTIADALGRPLPRWRVPEQLIRSAASLLSVIPGFPLTLSRVNALTGRSVYAIDRIQNELGYSPVISMEEGLRQIVTAYRSKRSCDL
jgi:nucleoside-diphosphate-sugar epimerase